MSTTVPISPKDVLSIFYSTSNSVKDTIPALHDYEPSTKEVNHSTTPVKELELVVKASDFPTIVETPGIGNEKLLSSVVSCSSLDTNESVGSSDGDKKYLHSIENMEADKTRQNLSPRLEFSAKEEEEAVVQNLERNECETIEALRAKLQSKDDRIESQRGELEQYYNMAQKYRCSVREKMQNIRALEQELAELRCNTVNYEDKTASTLPTNSKEKTNDSKVITNEEDCEGDNQDKIQQIRKELLSQRQIIGSLTSENNSFRKEAVDHLQDRVTLTKETALLKEKIKQLEEERDSVMHTLELKTGKDESLVRKLAEYESNQKENQIEMITLRREVIRLQNIVDDGEKENIVFQKLLSTSRETASFAMMNSIHDCEKEGKNSSSLVSSQEENTRRSGEKVVAASLRKQLEATKKREEGLLRQLSQQLDEFGMDAISVEDPVEETELKQQLRDSKCSIMEQLSDSQQEAINFLSSEVEELRSELELECKEKEQCLMESEKKEKAIEILKKESELFASETVDNETERQVLERNLSTKLGENKCLRDEIKELEAKTKQIPEIEATILKKDEEYQKLDQKMKELTKAKSTVDSEGAVQTPEGLTQSRSHRVNNDKAKREISVLKKALKQTYEKKFQELEEVLHERDLNITQLKTSIDSKEESIIRQQKELNGHISRRMTFEAELQEDKENLQNSLIEREREIEFLRKNTKTVQESDATLAWEVVRETVRDGVAASLDVLQSMTYDDDDDDNTNEMETNLFSFSSRSFG